ncbi:hypothetical protein [Nostoc sp. MG11]|uniref:hypothetical protein n=1 Tax=Nostoc sp. MG11 TaxID=2721166 RepID=UPI0018681D1C|nr:hypothetical protein [Nostoc sp. MG11]
MTQYSYSTCITGNIDGTFRINRYSYRCDFGHFSDRTLVSFYGFLVIAFTSVMRRKRGDGRTFECPWF